MCAPVGACATSWPSIKIGDCHPEFPVPLIYEQPFPPCLIASTSNDVSKRNAVWVPHCCLLVFPQTAVECHRVSLEILMYSELPIEFPELSLYIDQETMILEISYVNFLSGFWLQWRMRYWLSGFRPGKMLGLAQHLSRGVCFLHELVSVSPTPFLPS